jgi:acyl-CoA thioester hydrolase
MSSRTSYRTRDAYRYWHAISTRWHDNDAYGHINNTVYYAWFDTAVNAWLVETGLLDIQNGNPIGLVVETGCRYQSSLAFPQPVEIGLAASKIGNSSVTYQLGVYAAGAVDAAAEGHFTHVYVDRQSQRPISIPPALRSRLGDLV